MHGDETFGAWLKQRRKALDLTQAALARQVSCTVSTIKQLERGVLRPSKRLAEQLADQLRLPPDQRTGFVKAARFSPPSPSDASIPSLGSTPLRARTNLPVPPTPLIGRADDLAAVRATLLRAEVRLLTLTGAPGIGKTRLALQIAANLGAAFPDGVVFVALAPISDANLIIPAIAQVLGVRDTGTQPLVGVLTNYLQDSQLLLVLDNFEQVVSAAPLVASLLTHTSCLKVLLTSRVVLHVAGEHEYVVPPLALPNLDRLPSWDTVAEYAAVELFIRRAQAVKPDFLLTAANAPSVATICTRLDGLPLAIELAAARMKILPPPALLRRLDRRLAFLTGGAANVDARQQTLRQAIAWSYDLLNEAERQLFRRLGVFAGSCTAATVEAVCGELSIEHPPLDVEVPGSSMLDSQFSILDGLTALVDKSLLLQSVGADDEPRFRMLETIREYALERLGEHDEAAVVQQQHIAFYLALAEHAAPHLRGPDQAAWLDRLEREQDNLRAALQWSRMVGDAEVQLRLATALSGFWMIRGYWSECWTWLTGALEQNEHTRPDLRALALARAGLVASDQGDFVQAAALAESSLILARAQAHKEAMAVALKTLAWVAYYSQNDLVQARGLFEESLRLFQDLEDEGEIAHILVHLGFLAELQGDNARVIELCEESLKLARKVDSTPGIIRALGRLGDVALSQGDSMRAHALFEESLTLARELGLKSSIHNILVSSALVRLGDVALSQGDYMRADALLEESLTLARELGLKSSICNVLVSLGESARAQGNYAQAAAYYEEGWVLTQEQGSKVAIAGMLHNLGQVALQQGTAKQAAGHFVESLSLARELGLEPLIASCLAGFAGVAGSRGRPEQAARLFGAATTLFDLLGRVMDPPDRVAYELNVSAARAQLNAASFDTAWAIGQAMTMKQAIAMALEVARETQSTPDSQASRPIPHPIYPAGLTEREVEVLHLVAQGLTNAQVAEKLVISPRTVNAHLSTIYSKLGVSSRSAATRFAVEHQLA